MLPNAIKIEKLQEAIALLQDVDALQQVGLADFDSEACYEIHNDIESIIDNLEEAIEELKAELQ
jgi:hypothetical protein